MRRRGALRDRDRLPQRRHRGVPPRPRRQLRLHRDEPADPGGAHRDRGGHRRRPRAGPDAHRLRRDPRRPRAVPGPDHPARGGAPVPDHHRGPRQRVPSGHRPDHDLPLPRRRRRAARRRHDLHRRRGQRALRLDAGQAHLPRSRLHVRRGPRPSCPGRVPDPGRVHEHPVPPGAARRPGLPVRAHHDRVHRGAPAAADRALVGRPRHQAADLPRRGDGQQALRRGARQRRPGHQAARARPVGARPRRHPPAAAGPGPGGVRPHAARADPGRRHGHHLPRRAPVAARDPGPHA